VQPPTLLGQSIPPGLDFHLIMGNGSSHASAPGSPPIPGSPSRTPQARVLAGHDRAVVGVLTGKLLRRCDFTSGKDLETRITAFTIRHNKRARQHKWSYDADAEHARYLEHRPRPEPQTALPEAA
jgi:hypothetical protein